LWQKSIKTTPFFVELWSTSSTPMNTRINGPQIVATKWRMKFFIIETKKHLLAAQQRYKSYVDTKQCDVLYAWGGGRYSPLCYVTTCVQREFIWGLIISSFGLMVTL
jgi:hypothetical protein